MDVNVVQNREISFVYENAELVKITAFPKSTTAYILVSRRYSTTEVSLDPTSHAGALPRTVWGTEGATVSTPNVQTGARRMLTTVRIPLHGKHKTQIVMVLKMGRTESS